MDKRVDMINCVTGTVMSVPEALVKMYEAAGHKLLETSVSEEQKPKTKKKA